MRRFLYYVEIRTPGSVVYGQRLMCNTRQEARDKKRALRVGPSCRFVILRSALGSGADLQRVR